MTVPILPACWLTPADRGQFVKTHGTDKVPVGRLEDVTVTAVQVRLVLDGRTYYLDRYDPIALDPIHADALAADADRRHGLHLGEMLLRQPEFFRVLRHGGTVGWIA